MSEFVSVDSFLQELSSEGRLDSAGKFTLSLEHAKEKLSEFLLKSTQDYLLKLVQAGVAAGARTLDLRSSTGSLSFSMHGVSFDPIDLENILTHLLQPGQGAQARALRHLAIAINTAITTRATGITLATWDGHKGQKIFWKAGGRSSQPWRPFRSQPCVHFGVRRTVLESASQFWHLLGQRDIFSMLTGGRAGLDPDRQTVLDRAIWCPVPLALNGQWLPRPRLGPPRGAIFSRTQVLHSSWLPLDNPEDPGIRRFHQQGMAWPWSRHFDTTSAGAVNAGLQDSLSEATSQLNWVLDGVLVATQPIPHISMNQSLAYRTLWSRLNT